MTCMIADHLMCRLHPADTTEDFLAWAYAECQWFLDSGLISVMVVKIVRYVVVAMVLIVHVVVVDEIVPGITALMSSLLPYLQV